MVGPVVKGAVVVADGFASHRVTGFYEGKAVVSGNPWSEGNIFQGMVYSPSQQRDGHDALLR